MNDTILVILFIEAWLLYFFINHIGLRRLVALMYGRYTKEVRELFNDQSIPEEFKRDSGLAKERAMLEIVSKRRKPNFDLSVVISNIEFLLVSISTIFIVNKSHDDPYNVFMQLGIVAVSWLGIKTLGYGGHWQQPIFGRSLFSVFLIGTIINISLGIGAGIVVWVLAH